jgi:hypothetical protein
VVVPGFVEVGKVGGHCWRVLEAQEDWIHAPIALESHRKLQAELNARGMVAGSGAVQKTVRRLGLSFKKYLHAEEATKPDIAHKRR